jgi:aryl-alcohol dehydrogenase-like predicted oxidoreductase
MQKRKLGRMELELTTVGLGTWAIGGPWQYGWGPQDDTVSIDTILKAMELGVNWIDTAAVYGCGHSEEVTGQALRRMGHKPFVATKCGLLWNSKREKINNLTRVSIRRECDDSLKRLQVDRIDLYQMHWPIPDNQIEEAWEAMAHCVEEGKVRFLGACNVTIQQIERLQKVWPVAAIQMPYSLLSRSIEKDILDYCGKNGIGVVCYSPMQKGLLTGKFSADYLKTMSPQDHRLVRDRDFMSPRFEQNIAIVEELKKIAAERGKTVAQLAVAWVLRRQEVTSAIVGARKPKQIEETVKAGDWALSDDDIETINQSMDSIKAMER